MDCITLYKALYPEPANICCHDKVYCYSCCFGASHRISKTVVRWVLHKRILSHFLWLPLLPADVWARLLCEKVRWRPCKMSSRRSMQAHWVWSLQKNRDFLVWHRLCGRYCRSLQMGPLQVCWITLADEIYASLNCAIVGAHERVTSYKTTTHCYDRITQQVDKRLQWDPEY